MEISAPKSDRLLGLPDESGVPIGRAASLGGGVRMRPSHSFCEERDGAIALNRIQERYMKRWALVVVALYLLILVVLTVPVALLAFAPQASVADIVECYRYVPYWLWVGVMVLGQVALLIVPVRVASRRPITRRSLLWPIVTAGLMMGSLAVGAMYSLYEFAMRDKALDGWFGSAGFGSGVLIWGVWAGLFYRSSRGANPPDVVSLPGPPM